MQGRDLSADLLGGTRIEGRTDVYAFHAPGDLMLRTHDRKYLPYPDREVLYDLARDPDEFTNVATDPAYADDLRTLRDRAFARTVEASCPARERRLRF